tara:strand:- start:456 stop:662 length:207 start_codon:yes stop_codon:yes gene_type:complete
MFKKLIQNIFFSNNISEQEVLEAQKEWAYHIINIGKLYLKKGNYKAEAKILSATYMLTKLVMFYLSQL